MKLKWTMRRTAGLLLLSALLLGTASCGTSPDPAACSGSEPHMNIDIKDGISVYHGSQQYFYQVADEEIGALCISVQRESGTLDISVSSADHPDTCYYRGSDLPTCDFTVLIPDTGECRVWIEADDFVGNYQLNWSVQDHTASQR